MKRTAVQDKKKGAQNRTLGVHRTVEELGRKTCRLPSVGEILLKPNQSGPRQSKTSIGTIKENTPVVSKAALKKIKKC